MKVFQLNKQYMDRILVVDDNLKNIQVLATVLARNGYEVEYAINGSDAIEIVKSEDFELILLDIMMPEVDGFDACVAIKKIENKKDTPIIFLTAKNDIESITMGFDIGAVDFITKPFNDKELLRRVQTHIELKKSREKLMEINNWLENQVSERTMELNLAKVELEKANKELIRQDKTKTEFLTLISNEIRTPLNGISGFLYLMKKQNKIEGLEKYINPLDHSVRKLENFSIKAQLLTQITSTDIKDLDFQELNLKDLILFSINNLSRKIETKNIKVDIDSFPENVILKANDDFLLKSFEFIIENAIDCSMDGGRIEINYSFNDTSGVCEIRDFGNAFSGKAIDNMATQDFYSDQQYGLSLSIVKKVMEKHGGHVKIENLDVGSTVRLYFPVK
jgi:two-component system, sensor histidine kinase and response regulator